jgi:HPt (histidine-containing phosphotransfer) domain-containing protein
LAAERAELAAIANNSVDGEDVMTALAVKVADESSQNRRTDRSGELRILDEEHLQDMTLGDRRLEREVLQIFVRQVAIVLGRITSVEPAPAAAAAHTMLGSARGIGAWRVARAAERLERAAGEGSQEQLVQAIMELKAASLEASAAIGARLGDAQR